MAQGSFSAQVSGWVAETKERQDIVYRESVQRVVEIMQTPRAMGGNLPLDLGFLRASLIAGIGSVQASLTSPPDEKSPVSYDATQINLVIAGATIHDPVEARYTAVYARVAEYGAHNRPAARFVSLASQQWGRIVSEVCAEA